MAGSQLGGELVPASPFRAEVQDRVDIITRRDRFLSRTVWCLHNTPYMHTRFGSVAFGPQGAMSPLHGSQSGCCWGEADWPAGNPCWTEFLCSVTLLPRTWCPA